METLNASVAAIAQAWANNCNWSHDPTLQNLGQNIYMYANTLLINLEQCNFTKGVIAWYNETQWYDYASNTCQSGKVCGHYTQVS